MSAADSGGVLKPILLRSTTPTPNEKVMRYIQSMNSVDGHPDDEPPRSLLGSQDYRSNVSHQQSRVQRSNLTGNGNGHAANGHHEEEDGDDADSNVQQGERSDIGDPTHEPGPNDPPGPKYASYDSGPSFGNMGPMPNDEQPVMHPYGGGGWNPDWQQIRKEGSGTPPSKSGSRAPSNNGAGRPFSPAQRSKVQTEQGTAYPPLPESALGYANGDPTWEPPLSPRSRAWSKAPSISPSDSASHFPKPRAQHKSVVSNAMSRSPPPQGSPSPLSQTGGPNHQSRPFSPYRHAPTTEDLLHAAVRGRALAIPEVEEEKTVSSIKAPSQAHQSQVAASQAGSRASGSPSKQPSQLRTPQQQPASMAPSNISPSKSASRVTAQSKTASRVSKQPSVPPSVRSAARSAVSQARSNRTLSDVDPDDDYDQVEADIINDALAAQLPAQTPQTSIYARSIEPGLTGHFHDEELCQLLRHESDQNQPEVIRKALRKAIRQRVKKLGIHYDTEAIKEYKRSYQDHDHSAPVDQDDQEPPRWATDLKREIVLMQQRIESLGPKIENLRYEHSYGDHGQDSRFAYDDETRTPRTQTVNIETQATGTLADSMWQPGDEDMTVDEEGHQHHMREFDDMTETQPAPDTTQNYLSEAGREDSTGQQFLEEELYKLKQRPAKTQSALSHRTWEITKDNPAGDEDEEFDEDGMRGVPTIPDTNGEGYQDGEREGSGSPPLPPLPNAEEGTENGDAEGHSRQLEVHAPGGWNSVDYGTDGAGGNNMPPWQRIHSRLLSWAIIWPTSELENALNSTTRGHQVDEVALSVWSTQTYKRYVRARLTEGGNGNGVDRLFVPPNMADAISNAVFNGRHGEACGMLRDLWIPFGLEGTPRLIVVLARHRSDPNHWVVHRFSLPDGNLTTYDSYPERTLPDGRPLGWWFAIRIAWPSSMYPNPDNIVQKMVRLHRPMQLPIDNSVAAAGIWRNILMGSRAERSLDLERLRDLINTEVKNLKQRKLLGKLTVGGTRGWEETTR